MSRRKIILIVGLTGSGKSTLSNSIINKSGEIEKLQKEPFETSDSANGCTKHFQVHETDNETIIDTVGFADSQFEPTEILKELIDALKKTDFIVTHVIYTVQKGRFDNQLVTFFKTVQEKVFQNKCKDNSIILFSQAEKGWVQKQTCPNLNKAIADCGGRFYEYDLCFDKPYHDEDDKAKI
jgi:ribosome biogenesis GTPase A